MYEERLRKAVEVLGRRRISNCGRTIATCRDQTLWLFIFLNGRGKTLAASVKATWDQPGSTRCRFRLLPSTSSAIHGQLGTNQFRTGWNLVVVLPKNLRTWCGGAAKLASMSWLTPSSTTWPDQKYFLQPKTGRRRVANARTPTNHPLQNAWAGRTQSTPTENFSMVATASTDMTGQCFTITQTTTVTTVACPRGRTTSDFATCMACPTSIQKTGKSKSNSLHTCRTFWRLA
mmetsp:Transcript_7792/g.17990  ORF Transcript_7792/g.17990 Transcript_7792/m.17990 type:complete len:232 (+) Transcript_7792:2301-2996(+)